MAISRIRVFHLTLLLSLIFFCSGAQAAKIAEENEVKAAFIFNFLKFVEWPKEAFFKSKSQLKICLVEESELCEKVTLIDGKMAGQRLIKVEKPGEKSLCSDCQVLVICSGKADRIKRHLERFKGRPVLTIGDSENFTQLGGMIGLTKISGKVRFLINLKEAEASGLKISSQLLKLAVEVIR